MEKNKNKEKRNFSGSSSTSSDSGYGSSHSTVNKKNKDLYQKFEKLIAKLEGEKISLEEVSKLLKKSFGNVNNIWIEVDLAISQETDVDYKEGAGFLLIASTKTFLNKENIEYLIEIYQNSKRKVEKANNEIGQNLLHILANQIVNLYQKKAHSSVMTDVNEKFKIYEEMSEKFPQLSEMEDSIGRFPDQILIDEDILHRSDSGEYFLTSNEVCFVRRELND